MQRHLESVVSSSRAILHVSDKRAQSPLRGPIHESIVVLEAMADTTGVASPRSGR